MIDAKIGVIGCGNMGQALLGRLLAASGNVMACDADAGCRDRILKALGFRVQDDCADLVRASDVVIVAVKPNDIDSLLRGASAGGFSPNKILISIAAGVTTAHIERIVGADVPVIRVMPNLPAVIGAGISSISAGRSASASHRAIAREIFSVIGSVIEVPEDLVDAITATSGSGPAYLFYLAESLIDAAVASGLSQDLASRLVVKTILGSAMLLDAAAERPSELRLKVTSKGGTTEAALRVFESKGFREIVKDAVKEAHRRAAELSKG